MCYGWTSRGCYGGWMHYDPPGVRLGPNTMLVPGAGPDGDLRCHLDTIAPGALLVWRAEWDGPPLALGHRIHTGRLRALLRDQVPAAMVAVWHVHPDRRLRGPALRLFVRLLVAECGVQPIRTLLLSGLPEHREHGLRMLVHARGSVACAHKVAVSDVP